MNDATKLLKAIDDHLSDGALLLNQDETNRLRCAIRNYLAKPEQEPIGEIEMLGNNGVIGAPFYAPVWKDGIQPTVGTELFIEPQAQRVRLTQLEDENAALRIELEKLRSKTAMTLGVGDGAGQLFVHGDYDSIKACQSKLFERDALKARIDGGVRVSVGGMGSLLGFDSNGEKNATLIFDAKP